MVAALLGARMPTSTGSPMAFAWLIAASVLLGLILGRSARRLALTRAQHFVLWSSVIFFNLGAVAIEGAYFVPDLVPIPIPVLMAQQALASVGAALAITLLFGAIGRPASTWSDALRTRAWSSWSWRFLLSAAGYVAFYYVFGSLNYTLVTKPYYDAHAGGLTAPAPSVVLMAELVRAPLIVLSILLFLLSARGTRRRLMRTTGWLLFAVGGIVPLVLQISTLPLLLLAASAVEIFCQNFLTGAVAAYWMGIEELPDDAARPAVSG